ncbi:MAG: hypothetical protein AB7Q97_06135 [Gammaproteobacteria bacterium]
MKTSRLSTAFGALLFGATLCTAVPAWASPLGLEFKGTLADGGWFTASLYYGDTDFEGVGPSTPEGIEDFGRYHGAVWDVAVRGGTTTQSALLSNTGGGRAEVETRNAPPLIYIVFLGPLAGEVPRLELAFQAAPTYDADVQPTRSDIVGFYFDFSRFQDANGVSTQITGVEVAALPFPPTTVPVPGAFILAASALGLLLPAARRRAGRAAAAPTG